MAPVLSDGDLHRAGTGDGEARATADHGTPGVPPIAVLFSAYNEESVIEQRLANLAALDYPSDRLRVWVGVDGGTDRTAQLARAWAAAHREVTVVVAERNRGKMAMLKRLVDEVAPSSPSLLVFTDANTMFQRDTLRRLAAPFADPAVGGVCGRLVLEHGAQGATDERAYWDAEAQLKQAESTLDSCLGANGAVYAIRAELFPRTIPDNTIVDDFVIGMKIREQGFRMVFEPAARAREELPAEVSDEWRRRVRIGAGAYQALVLCRRCLGPEFGVFAWAFWSHKVLRWFTPHLLLVAVGLGGAFVAQWFVAHRSWAVTGGLAGAVAAAVLSGWLACRNRTAPGKAIRLIGYFLAMQAALLAGFARFCRGNLSGAWQRTGRVTGHEPGTTGG